MNYKAIQIFLAIMKIFGIAAILLAAALPAGAQTSSSAAAAAAHARAKNQQQASYDQFRQQLLQDYKDFRKSILEDYDKFLEQTWENFEQFKREDKFSQPKPAEAPTVQKQPAPQPKPAEKEPEPTIPEPDPVVAMVVTPTKITPIGMPPLPVFTAPDAPTVGNLPINRPKQPVQEENLGNTFNYRGMQLEIADVDFELRGRLLGPEDFAAQWRNFKNNGALDIVDAFSKTVEKYNLNDFLTYDALKAYVLDRYPDAHPSVQLALVHFVLLNMGYDVRLGLDSSKHPVLMLPFAQQVYARNFLTTGGKQYYVFPLDSDDPENRADGYIATCKLPDDRDLGRSFDLRINDLRLPEKPKDFQWHYGPITLTGQLNANLIPVLYRYPQMPTEDFAISNVSPGLRQQLVTQIKEQLAGKTQRESVDALLKFTQSAFRYATDGAYHGFEKPYFVEETLYYDKCDCEDRSIFYTFMLWNALGVENHLLAYPVHEAAAVQLDEPLQGDAYTHEGKTFYISDPTYIGSRTGMCMPQFRKTAPKIDLEYKH